MVGAGLELVTPALSSEWLSGRIGGGDRGLFTEAGAQGEGSVPVAMQTEGAEVVEVAFAAAFDDGDDVVGIPEAFAAAPADAPVLEKELAARAPRGAKPAEGGEGIGAADGADAAVAQEDLVAEIAWLGAKLPLVHAVAGAEGEAAAGNFERAPAAEAAAVGAAGDGFAVDPASGHGAYGAHLSFLKQGGVWKGE